MLTSPLEGTTVVTTAINVPGPVAAARLTQLGAKVIKIEPPQGDPLSEFCPDWYQELIAGQTVIRLNLKESRGQKELSEFLQTSDLLLTSMRPVVLERLGLAWTQLNARFPLLSQICITGFGGENENMAGHDLTYQARAGLCLPPQLPPTLLADLATSERVISIALVLTLARARKQESLSVRVAIDEVLDQFIAPLRYGLTAPRGLLAGGFPGYNLYRAQDGWIAVAVLERHFWLKLISELGLPPEADQTEFERVFLTRKAHEWESWALLNDLPLVAVKGQLAGSSLSAKVIE